jgi:hypothetical protein
MLVWISAKYPYILADIYGYPQFADMVCDPISNGEDMPQSTLKLAPTSLYKRASTYFRTINSLI